MKRIVLCLDGTWNTVGKTSTPTNVVRFAQAVKAHADDGVDQISYYNAGVGTDGPLDKILGGVFGAGLQRNVQRAYLFCALNYRPGDEIYLYGFSRGAYTARAVAGIIGEVGLVRPAYFDRFEGVWDSYRQYANTGSRHPKTDELTDRDVPIKCVGVWDTVGSYGIPAGYGLGALIRMFTWRHLHFHDTGLGKKIGVALHALALDEHRRPFAPTFWTKRVDAELGSQICHQVWFAGAHSNVGGGYLNHDLSDVAMVWMMARSEEKTGLRFDLSVLKGHVTPNVTTDITNSLSWFYLLSRAFPFNRPVMASRALDIGLLWNDVFKDRVNINEAVHWSVRDHYARVSLYRPANLPNGIKPEWVMEKTPREQEIWNEV